jgi:coenzyme Q-binding protein COQ10
LHRFSSRHAVPYSARQMFDLVADVEAYPQFLPMCETLAVRQRREKGGKTLLVAVMGVGYKAVRAEFTSQVLLDPENLAIDVQYLDGPFRRLDNRWRFIASGDHACEVDFFIEYEFSSRVLGALMGAMFDRAFRRFTAAFEERAGVVYGPPVQPVA